VAYYCHLKLRSSCHLMTSDRGRMRQATIAPCAAVSELIVPKTPALRVCMQQTWWCDLPEVREGGLAFQGLPT